jgi:hypothetical protein
MLPGQPGAIGVTPVDPAGSAARPDEWEEHGDWARAAYRAGFSHPGLHGEIVAAQ